MLTANTCGLEALVLMEVARYLDWVGSTVTWSIQTRSASSRVMASPPQTYLGLMSVMAIFLEYS